MNSFTLLVSKVKIRKCPSYFSGFFITLEWHLCRSKSYQQRSLSILSFNHVEVTSL